MFVTLTDHDAIRAWAALRQGDPAMVPLVDEPALGLVFGNEDLRRPDLELVRWDTWFAELDRQRLALRVREDDPARPCEIVRREFA